MRHKLVPWNEAKVFVEKNRYEEFFQHLISGLFAIVLLEPPETDMSGVGREGLQDAGVHVWYLREQLVQRENAKFVQSFEGCRLKHVKHQLHLP